MTTNNPTPQPAGPFKVGDRVRNRHANWPEGKITEITERGFRYEYDKPFWLSPRLGYLTGGEAYRESFDSWEVVAQPGEGGVPERIWVSREYAANPDNHRQLLIDDLEYVRTPSTTTPTDIAERARRAATSYAKAQWCCTGC